jgi:hypothetical protein
MGTARLDRRASQAVVDADERRSHGGAETEPDGCNT